MTLKFTVRPLQTVFYSLFFWLSANCVSYGQNGDFILTHHAPKHSEIDNNNFEITADKNGIICVANRFGVLKYDGLDWGFYRTHSSALSLAVADDNTVFVGCLGEFGKLDFSNGEYGYVPLLEGDSISDHFLQTFSAGSSIYFLSGRNLYEYSVKNQTTNLLKSGDFLNGYQIGETLFVNTVSGSVIMVADGAIEDLGPSADQWGIVCRSPGGENEFAVDLDGGIFKKSQDVMVKHHHHDKLKEADVVITDLEWVNDSLIACATINSGVFFLHVNDTSYFEVTDYHSGLPDNEIYDLYADDNQGVWVAHEFGLTRIAPLFPANSYTNYPGLEGNLIEAQRIKGALWVNTSLGVYYFSQDTSYRSRVYVEQVVKKPSKRRSEPTTKVATPVKEEPTSEEEPEVSANKEEQDGNKKKKKGFLRGLLKKKDRSKESSKPEEEQGFFKKVFKGASSVTEKQEETAQPKANNYFSDQPRIEYIRRVEKIVTGISYQFHHVPGTDGKFRQLLEAKDQILATSYSGIYEISKKSAEMVINDEVKFAFVIPGTNRLLVSTREGYLNYYDLIAGIWTLKSSQYFEDVILNAIMDHTGDVWLAGTSHIYQGSFSDEAFSISHNYEFNNRFYDELSIWEHSDNLYFITSQGYFRLDRQKDRIIEDHELEEELGLPHLHLHNEKSRVWVFNGKIWCLLQPDGSVSKFNYLGVFPNLKYANYDEVLDRYWLITDDNQLLAYSTDQTTDLSKSYALFVKSLKGKNGALKVEDMLELSHDENSITIEMLKPDYVGLLNPEYQFRLEGLNKEWSDWTHANLIDYSYLLPGKYKLHVRVRDALGQVEEVTLLQFSISTPYWQQPWFYLVQMVVLAFIIGFTSRLDESKMANRIVKHGLSILILVVIIEFLQAVIAALVEVESTPVIDFLIDAGVAVMIFPLEWVLRKLFLGGGFKLSNKSRSEAIEETVES